MEQRVFGNTGLHVPVVGMGTWHTFDVTGKDADERTGVVDAAFETGATLFDSSPMYGEAERVLGRALRGRRDQAIVATKVWASDDSEAQKQITASIAYFRRRVDIYQVHNLVAWRARLDQLQRLRDSGVVQAIGVTHYSAGAAEDLLRAMRDPRVQAVQIPYNPRERWVESSVLPAAADLALGVIVMRPFGEGALLRMRVSQSALEPLKPFGISSWPQALLKWILSDPRCHVAIPATASPDHLHTNAAAGFSPWLGREERDYITKLAG
jgi:aryl-alcohol dehydrogenase-like predicted oxidoreductase